MQRLCHRNDVGIVTFVAAVLPLKGFRNHVHVLPGLAERHTWLQPGNDSQTVTVATTRLHHWCGLHRNENFPLVTGSAKAGRQNASKSVRTAIQHKRAAQSIIRAEISSPKTVGHDHDASIARRLVRRRKSTTDPGLYAKNVEVGCGHCRALYRLWVTRRCIDEIAALCCRHRRKHVVLVAPVREIGERNHVIQHVLFRPLLVQHGQTFWLRIRKTAKHRGIGDAGYSRHRSDSQGEIENGRCSETGTMAERTQTVRHILAEFLPSSRRPYVANVFFDFRAVTEGAHCG
jgi:hypothetical protein